MGESCVDLTQPHFWVSGVECRSALRIYASRASAPKLDVVYREFSPDTCFRFGTEVPKHPKSRFLIAFGMTVRGRSSSLFPISCFLLPTQERYNIRYVVL
jgi:hypothetical protein